MRGIRSRRLTVVVVLAIFTIIIILPSVHESGKEYSSFDVSHMRYSGLDFNRFNHRLANFTNTCQTVNKSLVGYPKTLLYSKGLNTVYCPVPYAFSTWVKETMLKIESKPIQLNQIHSISKLQAIHSEALALNLKRSVLLTPERLLDGPQHTLVIVRDPWLRLIAAYNDIVVRQNGYHTQCSKFKDVITRELKFRGFLQCLLHYANGSHSLDKLDLKLSPIHTICSVCRVPYTIIVKYETLEADLYDYITTMRTKAKETFLQLFDQTSKPRDLQLKEVNSYINSVDRQTILNIQHLYALDFQLFNYAPK